MPFQFPVGLRDADFISRVRRDIRDQGVWQQDTWTTDGIQGSVTTAGSKPFRFKRAPIVPSGAVISLNAANQTVVYDVPPTGAQVSVTTETGEFYWANPPVTGQTIQATFQAYRSSDNEIRSALQDGMNELWPDIWIPATDSSILFSPMVWEYTLPAPLQDPRVTIIMVEVQPPAGILVSIPTGMWRRQGLDTLVMTKGWPAGSILRLTYNGRYVNLGDLDGDCIDLVCYYANYKLLLDQETSRTRAGDLVANSGEGTAPPEVASKTAELWLSEFLRKKQNRSVAPPISGVVGQRAVEQLGEPWSWNPV